MKKTLLIVSGLLAMASISQLEARWHANFNFGYHGPRRVYRPVYIQEPVYQTYCHPYTPVQYCPVYPQPVVEYVEYVDNREPEVAIMQDGVNMMFDAISRSSRSSRSSKQSHRQLRR